MDYWGYHLLLDCRGTPVELIKERGYLVNFVKTLVKAIDMEAYGEPILEHFATHDPDKAGWSLLQLIETSNISGHFVDKNGNFYLDVFSCKPFDSADVIEVVNEFFNPEKIKMRFLVRDADKEYDAGFPE
jgi:S-adenosylmethionine/arginine decarboxylase-like enzyme